MEAFFITLLKNEITQVFVSCRINNTQDEGELKQAEGVAGPLLFEPLILFICTVCMFIPTIFTK